MILFRILTSTCSVWRGGQPFSGLYGITVVRYLYCEVSFLLLGWPESTECCLLLDWMESSRDIKLFFSSWKIKKVEDVT